MAILKNHQGRRAIGCVLGRDIDGPVTSSARKDGRFPGRHLLDPAVGHVISRHSQWMRLPVWFAGRDRSRCRNWFIRPEPAEIIGKPQASCLGIMPPLSPGEPVLVTREPQGGGHVLIAQRPVAEKVVEVITALL
jgi:hypothetical protein